jgi:nitric oxide reductase subunit B
MARSVVTADSPPDGSSQAAWPTRFGLPGWLVLICVIAFSVLLWAGTAIYKNAPPVPLRVESAQHQLILNRETIQAGQEAYLARGGQHIGSIWGHGSYLAPDWTADVLHRWGLATAGVLRNGSPNFDQADWNALPEEDQAVLNVALRDQFKTNRFDPVSHVLVLTVEQATALGKVFEDYRSLLSQGSVVHSIPSGWFTDPGQIRDVTAFFSWTAWAAAADRPSAPYSYTANFPHDPLIGNHVPPQFLIWSIVSVVVLIAAIALFLFVYLVQDDQQPIQSVPERPSIRLATPSQKVASLFFGVAMALFLGQILMGMITAHYAVEGDGLYGVPIQRYLPYAATRTWHLQLAVFWIATCWLAAGLYFGPRFAKQEPERQAWGSGVLLVALTVVMVGSLLGTWAGIQGYLGDRSFWFGHQGYEYVELGRVWQLLLIAGMVFWLWLMFRSLRTALIAEGSKTGLNHFFYYSAVAIPLFYATGLMYSNRTPLSMAEYWRWWVVHLWVEGFFEVFATVAIAYLCSELGFLARRSALRASYLTTILYLGSGVIGTVHHLYFAGTPVFVVALGSVASALEVVPLALVGFEVVKSLRLSREADGFYRIPLKFFLATCFWNLVGAGVFGLLINPPIVLYYSQGINTTPIHAHSALYGVYGSLAIALMLFALREITPDRAWDEKALNASFYWMNGGLMAMLVFGLIPNGFYQLVQSVNQGTWYARSAEVISSPWMRWTVWLRIPGDIVFGVGALILVVCVARALLGVFQQPTLGCNQLPAAVLGRDR